MHIFREVAFAFVFVPSWKKKGKKKKEKKSAKHKLTKKKEEEERKKNTKLKNCDITLFLFWTVMHASITWPYLV